MRLLAVSLVLLFFVWPALAKACQGGGKTITISSEELFQRADQNQDGYVSFREFSAVPLLSADAYGGKERYFETIDTDRDGELTLEEWDSVVPAMQLKPQCE